MTFKEFIRLARTRADAAQIDQSYFEKLLSYIPADIVAGYVALNGVIANQSSNNAVLQWIVFGVLMTLTPLYICYMKTAPSGLLPCKVFPCLAGMFAFAAWVFALGGPFAATWSTWYQPVYGSIALILTTLAIPVFEKAFYAS